MKARFIHRCTHVLDKEATIAFYQEALGFRVVRESGPEDGSWTNTFMVNDESPFELELTWARPYVEGSYPMLKRVVPALFFVDALLIKFC